MSDDIEEFLRRAAARRQQRQGQPQQPPQQAQRPQPQRPQQRPAYPPPVPDIQIVEPEIVEAQPVHQSVGNQVQQYFGSSNLIAGGEVDQADEQMDAHLHKVFDHSVGQLRDTSVGAIIPPEGPAELPDPSAKKPPTTNVIADMLKSPKTMRQAIILSEIMKRPYVD